MEFDRETEIDLWELLANGWIFFKTRMLIILLFLTIGLIYGIGNFFTHPLEYKSFYKQEFIAQSSVTSTEILSEIINQIPINITNDKNSNFPEFRNIKGKLEANRNNENRLKVIIEIFDATKIDALLDAIESHISSIDALKKKYNFKNQQLKQLLAELTKHLDKPDSENLNHIELLEKKQSIEKQLTQDKIVDFIPLIDQPVPVSNTRAGVLNVLGYSFLGLVLGFVIAWLLDLVNRKK